MINMLPSISANYQDRYSSFLSNAALGYIATPKKFGISRAIVDGKQYIIDNGVFSGQFDPRKFIRMLIVHKPYTSNCIFVAAPDVVGNWRGTLRRFRVWEKAIKNLGFPIAIVLQDEATIESIPWEKCDAIFIGGSTEWKLSQDVIDILRFAKCWRHIGRVNSIRRMLHFWDCADSFDGSGFAFEPDGKLKLFLPAMNWRRKQCSMF